MAFSTSNNSATRLFLPHDPEAREATIKVFKRHWEIVSSHQQDLADKLLDRIAKKQAEVKSLRDGVSHPLSE